MVVLRSKGETSIVFFRKWYTTAIAKKPQKKVVFYHKIEDFGAFWGYGPRWGPGLESSWQKGRFPRQKGNDFGGHFGTFSAFERRYF